MQRYTTRPDLNDLFTPLPIYFLSFILRYRYMLANAYRWSISTHHGGDFCFNTRRGWENLRTVTALRPRLTKNFTYWLVRLRCRLMCVQHFLCLCVPHQTLFFALGLEYIVLWLLAKIGPPLWGLKWWYGYGTSTNSMELSELSHSPGHRQQLFCCLNKISDRSLGREKYTKEYKHGKFCGERNRKSFFCAFPRGAGKFSTHRWTFGHRQNEKFSFNSICKWIFGTRD